MKNKLFFLFLFVICQAVNILAGLAMLLYMFHKNNQAWKIAVSYDQLMNTVLYGDEDETISSRAYKSKLKGEYWGKILCYILDKVQADHCKNSVELDRGEKI